MGTVKNKKKDQSCQGLGEGRGMSGARGIFKAVNLKNKMALPVNPSGLRLSARPP